MEAYSSSQMQNSSSTLAHYQDVYSFFIHKITELNSYEKALASVALRLIDTPATQLRKFQQEFLSLVKARFTKVEFRKPSHMTIATVIESHINLHPSEKDGIRKSNQEIVAGKIKGFLSGQNISENDPVRIEELTKLAQILMSADEFDIAKVVISEISSAEVRDQLLNLLKTIQKPSLDFAGCVMQMKCATEVIDLTSAKKLVGTKLKSLPQKELAEIKVQGGKHSGVSHPALASVLYKVEIAQEQWEYLDKPDTTYEDLMLELINKIIERKKELEEITNFLEKGEGNKALDITKKMKTADKRTIKIYSMIIEHCKNKGHLTLAVEALCHMPECVEKLTLKLELADLLETAILNYLEKGESDKALDIAKQMKSADSRTIKIYSKIIEHCKNKGQQTQAVEALLHMPECEEKTLLTVEIISLLETVPADNNALAETKS